MTTLIACIDNSAASRSVLAAADAVAHLLGASVEAVHVVEDGDVMVRAAADDASVPLRVVHGNPVDELIAATSEPNVVAVAVGARDAPSGRRTVGHLTLALANHLAVPVLVVPPRARPADQVQRVLIALKGDPGKPRPLKSVVDLGSTSDLELVVIHVDDESSVPSFSDQVQHETHAYADEFLARFIPGAPDAHLELRVGVPSEEILDAVESTGADLLALGWPQTEDPKRGAVADELLERCSIPMLLVAIADA